MQQRCFAPHRPNPCRLSPTPQLVLTRPVTRVLVRHVPVPPEAKRLMPRAGVQRGARPKPLFGEPGGLRYPRAELSKARPSRPRTSRVSMGRVKYPLHVGIAGTNREGMQKYRRFAGNLKAPSASGVRNAVTMPIFCAVAGRPDRAFRATWFPHSKWRRHRPVTQRRGFFADSE